jgi:hypothetical protein
VRSRDLGLRIWLAGDFHRGELDRSGMVATKVLGQMTHSVTDRERLAPESLRRV